MAAITLAALEEYMIHVPTRRITVEEILDTGLFDTFRQNIDTQSFVGDRAEMLIRTSQPFTGKAHIENADLPTPQSTSYVKHFLELKEVIATAGLTRQAMLRATGGAGSWGRIVEDALEMLDIDFAWLLKVATIGNGRGILARANGGPAGQVVTVDNTYTDFGWENTALVREGMQVSWYHEAPAGTWTLIANSGGDVAGVTFGDFKDGDVPARTGTITMGTATATTNVVAAVVDGDVCVLTGSIPDVFTPASQDGYLPMGLLGMCQNAGLGSFTDGYLGLASKPFFQGITRTLAGYPSLLAKCYQATDFGPAGSVDGTPTTWDLGTWSDIIADIQRGSGKGKVTRIITSSKLAAAATRLAKTSSNVNVVVNTSTAAANAGLVAAGDRYAQQFLTPDGRLIPIQVDMAIPDNVAYFITNSDITMYPMGAFDFLREYGTTWEPSRGNRKTNFEAPYGGFYNIGADRCDNMAVCQDLSYKVG